MAAALRQGQACLRWKKVDGPGAISVLFDEAAVVLRSRGRVHGSPAVLAVVAQAVDVATEVGGIAVAAVHSVTLITHLVVQHIWLHFNLQEKGWGGGRRRIDINRHESGYLAIFFNKLVLILHPRVLIQHAGVLHKIAIR